MTVDARREEQLRIQALGAALSRREWWEVEQAYNRIRDEFDRRPTDARLEAAEAALAKMTVERDALRKTAGQLHDEANRYANDMVDWQARATKAEAALAKAVEALRPFATAAGVLYDADPDNTSVIAVTAGDLRRARAAMPDTGEDEHAAS